MLTRVEARLVGACVNRANVLLVDTKRAETRWTQWGVWGREMDTP
jgi:hypothetical protein